MIMRIPTFAIAASSLLVISAHSVADTLLPTPKTSTDARAALGRMTSAAEDAIKQMSALEEIRLRAPEFLQMKLDWFAYVREARLRSATNDADRSKAMESPFWPCARLRR